MALIDNKITDNDVSVKGVVAAPDRMLGTADENKRVFDRLIREAVKGKLNQLIDNLRELGVEHIIRSVDGEGNITYLRVGADGLVETSTDGVNWGTTALKELARQVHEDASGAESAETSARAQAEAAARSQYYAEQAARQTSEDYRVTDIAKVQAETARDKAEDEADRAEDEAGRAWENAEKAKDEADRAESEAGRAQTEAGNAKDEADLAEREADRAANEADRAGAAAAEAVQAERLRNDRQDARLANLEAAAQGKLYREEVDDSTAYTKAVPAGSLPYAAVTSVESVELDGVIYNPAAVLVNGVNLITEYVAELIAPGAIIAATGKRYAVSSVTAIYRTTTRYLNVEPFRGMAITYSADMNSSTYGIAFYSEDRENAYLSGQTAKDGKTVVVPENATYARFTFALGDDIPMVVVGDAIPEVREAWTEPDRYPVDALPLFIGVGENRTISFENDKGEMIPLPSSVTYAINVQEAIANE